jgi:choline dehydrogenase-like flavoprotein
MRAIESDVCVIGGGISAALLAQKLAELRPGLAITVLEAGRKIFDVENGRRTVGDGWTTARTRGPER